MNKDEDYSDNAAPGMRVEELAAYIKEQKEFDTWEETCYFLVRLLHADLQIQEQLIDQGRTSEIPKPIQLLFACAKELGWGFALKKAEEGQDDLNGMTIGNKDYLMEFSKTGYTSDDMRNFATYCLEEAGDYAEENGSDGIQWVIGELHESEPNHLDDWKAENKP